MASLATSLVALVVSVWTIVKSNRNASVATLVSLNQGFRQAWDAFYAVSDDEARFYNLAELLNLLETACAIQVEGSLYGVSRTLMRQYLDETLTLLIKNQYTNGKIAEMLNAPTTFCYIKQVLRSKQKYLSVTAPPKWYEQ